MACLSVKFPRQLVQFKYLPSYGQCRAALVPSAHQLATLPLGEVDEGGVGEERHGHQHQQQAQLLEQAGFNRAQ